MIRGSYRGSSGGLIAIQRSCFKLPFTHWVTLPEQVRQQCWTIYPVNLRKPFKDEHCIDLVKTYQLERKLLEIFKAKDHPTLQYAILGCLKHLCLPSKSIKHPETRLLLRGLTILFRAEQGNYR